jgi:hypothetical protein
MPYLEALVLGLNRQLNKDEVRRYCKEHKVFSTPGLQLAQLAGTLGAIDESAPKKTEVVARWKEYLGQIPAGLQEAMRSVISLAIERDIPLAFAWEPAYDFEVAIWHTPDGRDTKGGIKVRLRSRYPHDTLPALR